MASNVTLEHISTSRKINGWVIEDVNESIEENLDPWSYPLGQTQDTDVMQFDGRQRKINLTGWIVTGNTLGTGSNMNVTTLPAQVQAINTYFVNSASGTAGYDTADFKFITDIWTSGLTVCIDSFNLFGALSGGRKFRMTLTEGSNL